MIVPRQLRQRFYNLKRHNPIYQIFLDTLPGQSKTNNFPWHPIKSFFQISKYKKQLLIFGSEFFSKSPQNKRSINSPSLWHKPILHFINIYHLTQALIQNLLIQFKSMFKRLYSLLRVWIKGIPFPLKICTNELNIRSTGNLSLSKISFYKFAKDFKHYPHQP